MVRSFNWTSILPKITLTITAMSQTTLRITSISTIVNLDVLDINDAPEFVGSTTTVVVGYPERTYFDPSVRMPLFTVKVSIIKKSSSFFSNFLIGLLNVRPKLKAFDSDSKENASLTYHLADEFEIFDIDALSGSLYGRGLDSLDSTSSRTVQVLAKDKHGLQDTLSITVSDHKNAIITIQP